MVDITNTVAQIVNQYLNVDTLSVKQYVNSNQHSIVITANATAKIDIPVDTALPIAQLSSSTYMPKGNVRTYWIQPTFAATLIKNNTNLYVALSCHSGTIPAGTTIDLQLEWHYF